MKFLYETNRLILKILDGSSAEDVLRFYLSNCDVFERYEAERPDNFYTVKYQRQALNYEYNMCLKQRGIRFWIYEKTDPAHVIGTVCFRNILRAIYQSGEIGYKFDQLHWHRGYAYEALCKCIMIAFQDLNLHRITANIMPGNVASIRLVERVGFEREGVARQNALICGKWQDHIVYSIIHK